MTRDTRAWKGMGSGKVKGNEMGTSRQRLCTSFIMTVHSKLSSTLAVSRSYKARRGDRLSRDRPCRQTQLCCAAADGEAAAVPVCPLLTQDSTLNYATSATSLLSSPNVCSDYIYGLVFLLLPPTHAFYYHGTPASACTAMHGQAAARAAAGTLLALKGRRYHLLLHLTQVTLTDGDERVNQK